MFSDRDRRRMEELAKLAESVRPAIEAAQEAARAAMPPPEWFERASKLVAVFHEAFRASLPANWEGFSVSDVRAAVDLMLDHGLNVAWVPRNVVVRALVGASDFETREAILVEHEAAVVDDLEACLGEIQLASLSEVVEAMSEAVAAYRAGFFRAAQALAATTLGSLLLEVHGDPKFRPAKERFEAMDIDGLTVVRAREAAVLRCVARAIEFTWVGLPGFNRHATAHGSTADQFTRPNALSALLLVVGVAREAAFWEERGES